MTLASVLVITGYGTNCERETAHAATVAGADRVTIAFFSDLVSERVRIDDYNLLVFPGGFLDGDDLGASQAAAQRWKYTRTTGGHSLEAQVKALHDRGGLILGICNGFQLLVKMGLLPAVHGNYGERQVSLSHNDSARFEDRWVHLVCNPASPCLFTRGLDRLYLPVRHGEGKLIIRDHQTLEDIRTGNLIAVQYCDPETGIPTQDYPANPNGSPLGIAGLTDPSGQIFGLMPHPEAYNHPTNHPAWTRGEQQTLGVVLFENGIRHLQGEPG